MKAIKTNAGAKRSASSWLNSSYVGIDYATTQNTRTIKIGVQDPSGFYPDPDPTFTKKNPD